MALGLVFVINTVALGYLYNDQRNQSAVDSIKTDSLIPATPVQTESSSSCSNNYSTPTVPENK